MADSCRLFLSHLSFSCSLWQTPLIPSLPEKLFQENQLQFCSLSHLPVLLPDSFPGGLAICPGSRCVNLTPLAEPSAGLISRKAGGAAGRPVPSSSRRAPLRSVLVQASQRVQRDQSCPQTGIPGKQLLHNLFICTR